RRHDGTCDGLYRRLTLLPSVSPRSTLLPCQAACKAALQQELGLPVRPDVPLIGFIGRLDWQKGPDVIQAGVPELMTDDVQFVSGGGKKGGGGGGKSTTGGTFL
ncbi:unnamed protein product, partial [Closterium sp. NIES-54]